MGVGIVEKLMKVIEASRRAGELEALKAAQELEAARDRLDFVVNDLLKALVAVDVKEKEGGWIA